MTDPDSYASLTQRATELFSRLSAYNAADLAGILDHLAATALDEAATRHRASARAVISSPERRGFRQGSRDLIALAAEMCELADEAERPF